MNGMIFEQDKTRMSSNETKLNGTSLQLNNIKIERDNRTIRGIAQSSQMHYATVNKMKQEQSEFLKKLSLAHAVTIYRLWQLIHYLGNRGFPVSSM